MLEENNPVSVLLIGKTGAGKSTIGNVILSGKSRGIFVTSSKPSSCTTDAETCDGQCAGIKVSVTDTPGIPDADPKQTKEKYDKCIDAIKKDPLSAILFVVEYGKINYGEYRKSALLFREINKVKCLKFLLINVKEKGFDDEDAPSEESFATLAEKIEEYTKVQYRKFFVLPPSDSKGMSEKLSGLVQALSIEKRECSPDVRTFTEILDFIKKAKSDVEIQEEARKRIMTDIEDKEKAVAYWKKWAGRATATGRFGVVDYTLALTFVALSGVPMLVTPPLTLLGYVAESACRRRVDQHEKEKKVLEEKHSSTHEEIQKVVTELKEEEANFLALAEALDAVTA